jgi:hypothetical protein
MKENTISFGRVRKAILLARALEPLPSPSTRESAAVSKEERRLQHDASKARAQSDFRAYVEGLVESNRRDLLALYYLGRGEDRTFEVVRKRVAGYKTEHIVWDLMQSASLEARLIEGIRIHSNGKFDLYPPTRGRKAKGSSPPRGAKIPDAKKKACQLAPDPVFAHPSLRPLAAMFEKFISGEERSREYVRSMEKEFNRYLIDCNEFSELWFVLSGYAGPENFTDVEILISECQKAMALRFPVSED